MVWYKCGSAFYINLNALDVNEKKQTKRRKILFDK